MATIIDGKAIADEIYVELKKQVETLKKLGHRVTLAVIAVGDDFASKVYIANKTKICEKIGVLLQKYELHLNTSEENLLNLIDTLNFNKNVDGILVQLPLPLHINAKNVVEKISPEKDVDGFCAENLGRIAIKSYKFLPCTPAGILEILHHEKIVLAGKHCVVLGRSNIVGCPLALLLLNNDATVTVCHKKTVNIDQICKTADILIASIGQPNFVKSDMVKPGSVVIDAGISRLNNGKICGDVDFNDVKNVASHITPVPGGVGPMTIAMLMKNVICAKLHKI